MGWGDIVKREGQKAMKHHPNHYYTTIIIIMTLEEPVGGIAEKAGEANGRKERNTIHILVIQLKLLLILLSLLWNTGWVGCHGAAGWDRRGQEGEEHRP